MDNVQTQHPVLAGTVPFAVISGANPKYRSEIDGGHKGFEQYLLGRGHKYEQTHGKYEPTFVVYGVPRNQAMDLGRRAGQESIIFSQNGQHEKIYVNGPNAGKHHPGTGHSFTHNTPTHEGSFLHLPNAGFVQFGFDTSKLLDIPKKGQNMIEDTAKSEVSVADFKKALAKTLQNQIDKLSKSLEDMAKAEVANSDGEPLVGELRLIKSEFSIEIPDTVCPTCFQEDAPGSCSCLTPSGLTKSTFGLTMAAAMKRVYDSYLHNVATPQFPDDPATAHKIALQVAQDWAKNVKQPESVSRMALGHKPEDYEATAHATPLADPDSMGPTTPAPKPPGYALVDEATAGKLGIPFKGGNYTTTDQHGNVTTNPGATLHQPANPVAKAELEKGIKGKLAAVGAAAALAGGAIAGGTAKVPSDKEIKAHTSQFTQDKEAQPPANPHEKYRKTEGESAMCKTCKNEMCKCMDKGEKKATTPTREPNPTGKNRRSDWAKRKEIDSANDDAKRAEYAARGYDTTIKNMDWKAELGKSDEWMEKSAPPGFSEDTMHKLKGKYGDESAFKIAWAAYKKKNHGKKVDKSEMFIDDKNAGCPPKSTDEAKHGGPRVKNVGYETDKPAEPTKPVKGNVDEGSGGDVTKGKGLKKFGMPATEPNAGVGAPSLAMSKAKAGPPMAKPPSGGPGTAPKAVSTSKPAAPKAGIPKVKITPMKTLKTEMEKADVVGAARIGQAAQQTIQPTMANANVPPALKLPPSVQGPGASGLSLDTSPKTFKPGHTVPGMANTPVPAAHHAKSESGLDDMKKSLGSCLFCGKSEHPGVCNAT